MLTKVLALTLSMATSASAADFLRPTLSPADPGAGQFDRTGGYMGIHGSSGWSFVRSSEINNITGVSTFGTLRSVGLGGLAGFQAGYLIQKGVGIAGVEADASVADIRSTFSLGAGDSINRQINFIGSARTKIGLLFDNRAAIFLSGGLSIANVNLSVVDALTPAKISSTSAMIGYTAGFGVSYFLTSRISMTSEYRYFNFGLKSVSGNVFFDTFRFPTDNKIHTVRIGMNYHLDQNRIEKH